MQRTQTSARLAAYLGMTMMATAAEAMVDTQAGTTPAQVPEGSKEFTFRFRTEKIRNAEGEVIGEGKKRPNVSVILPFPSDSDMIDMFAKQGKEAEFFRDIIYEAIKNAGRVQINDLVEANPEVEITADKLDLSKLTFTAIANTAPESRAKPEIPEEVKNSFYEDYKTVMVAMGKEAVRIAKHIVLFKNEFRTCKFDKQALRVLLDSLNIYAAKTENMDDNVEVFAMLKGKAEKYLNAEEKNLVSAL